MNGSVTILDYGSGNLFSTVKAFEHAGARVVLTGDPAQVEQCERLVIPGVGAFGDCMDKLNRQGLIDPIFKCVQKHIKILGICVGAQILMEEGEEFGLHQGLGLIRGKVRAIEPADPDGTLKKIPHIGWSSLQSSPGQRWDHTILDSLDEDAHCYFVHSFAPVPERQENWLAETFYGSSKICAAVRAGNVYGCQFHPEKSGEVGLRIISNFLGL